MTSTVLTGSLGVEQGHRRVILAAAAQPDYVLISRRVAGRRRGVVAQTCAGVRTFPRTVVIRKGAYAT
jgi:hypothetical protein